MQSRYCLGMVVLLLAACAHGPPLRITLEDVLADPEAYEGRDLIIVAGIGDVLDRYDYYRDHRIEVTGELMYYGSRSFWTWYLLLADQDRHVRCYTRHYRLHVGRDAATLLYRASLADKSLTVNGFLRNDGIDIQEILYEGQLVRPRFIPPVMYNIPMRAY